MMILCASLATRPDRKFMLRSRLDKIAGEEIQMVDAVDVHTISPTRAKRKFHIPRRGGYAVRLTKLICIRKFLQSNEDYLLFLEDDVFIPSVPKLEKAIEQAKQDQLDVVFLGGNNEKDTIDAGPNWVQLTETCDNHALLLSRKGAKQVKKLWLKHTMPYSDRELSLAMKRGDLKAYGPREWLASQQPSFSDNTQEIRWGDLFKDFETDWGQLAGDDLSVVLAAAYQSKLILEFGCGGSSIAMARQKKALKQPGRIVTVDHNLKWINKVKEVAAKENLPLELWYCPPRREPEWQMEYSVGQLTNYLNSAKRLGAMDMVFVDGRRRIEALRRSLPYLRPNGLVLLHDWSRIRYTNELLPMISDGILKFVCVTPFHVKGDPRGMIVCRRGEVPA